MKYFFPALLTLLLCSGGCATSTDVATPPLTKPFTPDDISIPIVFYGDQSRRAEYAGPLPEEILVSFPLISGALMGSPNQDVGLAYVTAAGEPVDIVMRHHIERIQGASSEKEETFYTMGMDVYPQSTRFSRFGSFAFDAATEESLGGTGFIDLNSGNFLLLVYVDQPCRITGITLTPEENLWIYDIDIETMGFHWLQIETGNNPEDLKLTRAPEGIKPAIAVTVSNPDQTSAGVSPTFQRLQRLATF